MTGEDQKNWLAEKESAMIYEALAAKEKDAAFSAMFAKLARSAHGQARVWAKKIEIEGGLVPKEAKPSVRVRLILTLVRLLGAKPLRTVLAAAKVRGLSVYTKALPNHAFPARLEDVGRRHTGSTFGGNFRAAVFGINDGMVSNAALIFGIAGASSLDARWVILTGVAGLLAGAFSMAAGEYLSVRSQKDLFEYQIGLEAEELKLYPEEEAAELALIFEARGLNREEAVALSNRLIADPTRALDTLAREELGLNPTELGSAAQASLFSFCSFALGAFIPLLPFFFHLGRTAFVLSIGATALSLFVTGAVLSLFTGKGALKSGLRMLIIGASTATFTYVLGSVLGVTLQ